MQRSIRGVLLGVLILLVVAIAACGESSRQDRLPDGAWLFGDAAAASRLLTSLEVLEDTPAARWAAALRTRLAGCARFVAGGADAGPADLAGSIDCSASAPVPAALERLRGDADLAFILPAGKRGRLVGSLRQDAAGSVVAEARMPMPAGETLGALLVPGSEPAGLPALRNDDSLVHARLRPANGLDIGALVSHGSQADRLFRLRSELFLGHVLDGSWEAAIYMPSDQLLTPPMALALDYSLRSVAQAGVEKFVADLEKSWPIRHSPQTIAGHPGACFFDVKILPDLAPCYVVTERSIVVGWNPLSLETALAPGSASPNALGDRGGLVVELGRLPEADRRLRESVGRQGSRPIRDYVWERLRLMGELAGDQLELRLELDTAAAS